MEPSLRARIDDNPGYRTEAPRPIGETMSEGLEKVLRFAGPSVVRPFETPQSTAPSAPQVAPASGAPVTAREFAAALDNVRDVRQQIEAANDRVREAETRTHTLAQRAADELRSAESRIQALEARLRGAESRAAEAEKRAGEAEAWLRQIFSTIAQELPARG